MAQKKSLRPRRSERKNVVDGQAHIHATFNYIIMSLKSWKTAERDTYAHEKR